MLRKEFLAQDTNLHFCYLKERLNWLIWFYRYIQHYHFCPLLKYQNRFLEHINIFFEEDEYNKNVFSKSQMITMDNNNKPKQEANIRGWMNRLDKIQKNRGKY